eukprot:TRINITY_DN922_c0_g1_i1.p4 TRINITY_DN922_c0_g1~~TRINITY_DN922_c0_g1_i1.p4  ORF type:complete len:64 (+),score=15.47 TRINITY_DN922_c0_g1_i1:386-577(+)
MIKTDSAHDPTRISKPWKVFDKLVGTHKPDEKMIISEETTRTQRSPKARSHKKEKVPTAWPLV